MYMITLPSHKNFFSSKPFAFDLPFQNHATRTGIGFYGVK